MLSQSDQVQKRRSARNVPSLLPQASCRLADGGGSVSQPDFILTGASTRTHISTPCLAHIPHHGQRTLLSQPKHGTFALISEPASFIFSLMLRCILALNARLQARPLQSWRRASSYIIHTKRAVQEEAARQVATLTPATP